MKQEFKVGDLVRLPYWKEYFKVSFITGTEIELVYEDKYYATYPLGMGFIKKEETMQVKIKIDPSKKYRKVGTHEPVRIICTDRKTQDNRLPCVGLSIRHTGNEWLEYFDIYGLDDQGAPVIEEIPQTDWSKVQVDTLIWVRNTPRYFQGYDGYGDHVYYFSGGTTSLTNTLGVSWERAEFCSLERPNA